MSPPGNRRRHRDESEASIVFFFWTMDLTYQWITSTRINNQQTEIRTKGFWFCRFPAPVIGDPQLTHVSKEAKACNTQPCNGETKPLGHTRPAWHQPWGSQRYFEEVAETHGFSSLLQVYTLYINKYIWIHIYIYIHVCLYIYIYVRYVNIYIYICLIGETCWVFLLCSSNLALLWVFGSDRGIRPTKIRVWDITASDREV